MITAIMHFKRFLLIASILLGASGHAQRVEEDFLSGSPVAPWGWQVSGNSPLDTRDPTRLLFDGEWLQITLQPGTLYQGFNNIRNLPNLPVPPPRADWLVETRVRLQRNGASGAYVQAGLVLFRDADHYFNFHLVVDPSTGNLFVSTGTEWQGVYAFAGLVSAESWAPTQSDTVRLLIRQQEPNGAIAFYYDREDGIGWRELAGSPIAPTALPALDAFLTHGGFIGLYTDTAGWSGSNPPIASFDYFTLSMTPHPADIDQNGCVDDADLLRVLFTFGSTGCNLEEDLDRNGVVDDADLLEVLFGFGLGCELS